MKVHHRVERAILRKSRKPQTRGYFSRFDRWQCTLFDAGSEIKRQGGKEDLIKVGRSARKEGRRKPREASKIFANEFPTSWTLVAEARYVFSFYPGFAPTPYFWHSSRLRSFRAPDSDAPSAASTSLQNPRDPIFNDRIGEKREGNGSWKASLRLHRDLKNRLNRSRIINHDHKEQRK